MPIKNTNEEDAEISDLICMHMKNNAIINTKLQINENFLMLQSEMLIQEVGKGCAGFGSAYGSIYYIFALIIVLYISQM